MEQALLSRKYRVRRPASTLPLTYGAAFGAFTRRKTGINIPDDFASRMKFRPDMSFESFLEANQVELLDDQENA